MFLYVQPDVAERVVYAAAALGVYLFTGDAEKALLVLFGLSVARRLLASR